jgi:deazaflavin-dependent oxidoreductase (nitroreductase family)
MRRRWFIHLLWRFHRWFYRISRGRLGGRLVGMPVLLLTTIGRRSGRPHTTALTYQSDNTNFVVTASNGGARNHPAWLLNLRAHPEAEIQVEGRHVRVRARETDGAERERLWARVIRTYAGYAAYQARTSRRIPVVVLHRIDHLPDRSGSGVSWEHHARR